MSMSLYFIPFQCCYLKYNFILFIMIFQFFSFDNRSSYFSTLLLLLIVYRLVQSFITDLYNTKLLALFYLLLLLFFYIYTSLFNNYPVSKYLQSNIDRNYINMLPSDKLFCVIFILLIYSNDNKNYLIPFITSLCIIIID